MGSMFNFVGVIISIVTLLLIILLYKRLDTANNAWCVRKKKGRIDGVHLDRAVRKAVLNGDIKKAEDLLMDKFVDVMMFMCDEFNEVTDEQIAELKSEYSKYYEAIGSELPQSIRNLKTKHEFYTEFKYSM